MTDGHPMQRAVTRRAIFVEVAAVTAAVLAIARGLYLLRAVPVIGPHVSTLVGLLLLGTPMLVLWYRRRPLDFLSGSVRELVVSCAAFAVAAVVCFPPFLVGVHAWERLVLGAQSFAPAGFPGFANAALVQLVVIALPEEFYFRGYLQSALGLAFAPRWRILGVSLGWGWILTAVIFAIAHSFITYQWWHFAIFFPALLFGYLRERTGSIIAPTLFHAASNLLMNWIGRSYS